MTNARALTIPRIGRVALDGWTVAIALTATVGIVMRVLVYRSALGIPNSDEAVVGLMTRHALHGDFSTFFWGSAYGGPHEVILNVPFVWLLGSTWLALRIVPIVLHAVTCVVIWRVGRRTVGEVPARIAGLMFWVWPPFVVFQLTQQQSFYATNVLYTALTALLALRVVERPDRLRVALLGFMLGWAFWQSPQIVPIGVPIVLWTAWRQRAALQHLWLAVLTCLVGASPWIAWNATHGWRSLDVHSATLHTYVTSLRLLVSPLGLETIGLRAPFNARSPIPWLPVTYAIYGGLILAFLWAGWRSRRRDTGILFFTIALFPFIYAFVRMTAFITAWPQYTVIVTPIVALALARLAPGAFRGAVLVALAFLVTAFGLRQMDHWIKLPQPVPRAPRDFAPLISTLDRLHLDRIYTDYWIAYDLDYDSRERIVAIENVFRGVSFRSDGIATPSYDDNVRYRTYDREVRAAKRSGFVFFKRTLEEIGILKQLTDHGYTAHVVGPFVVYAPPGAAR